MKPSQRHHRSCRTLVRRQGIAVVSALVALVVMSALSVTIVNSVLTRVRETDQQLHQLQADSLAESAMTRAVAQRQRNPDYRTESWTPTVSGVVALRAEIEWSGEGETSSVKVICTVPADAEHPVRVERIRQFPAPLTQAK